MDVKGKIIFAKIAIVVWLSPPSPSTIYEDSEKILNDAITVLEGLPVEQLALEQKAILLKEEGDRIKSDIPTSDLAAGPVGIKEWRRDVFKFRRSVMRTSERLRIAAEEPPESLLGLIKKEIRRLVSWRRVQGDGPTQVHVAQHAPQHADPESQTVTMQSFVQYPDEATYVQGDGPIAQHVSQPPDAGVQSTESFVQYLDPQTNGPTQPSTQSIEHADPQIFMTISELVTGNRSESNNGSVGSESDDNYTMSSFVQPVPYDLREHNRDIMMLTYEHGELSVDQEFLDPANEERVKESFSMGDEYWHNISRAGPSGSG